MRPRNLSEVADCFISKETDKVSQLQKPADAASRNETVNHSLIVFGHNTIYRAFICCNLALEFSKQDYGVLAVDADPSLPTVDFLIGEDYPRSDSDPARNMSPPGFKLSLCYDGERKLLETCAANGASLWLTIPLLRSIIQNNREKFVVVNAPLSIVTANTGKTRLSRALIVSGVSDSGAAGTESILKTLLEHNPRIQLGMVFTRSDEPQRTRQLFLRFSGVTRALGVRPLLRFGALPDGDDIYASILYRKPIVLLDRARSDLKRTLEDIAIELLNSFCLGPSLTEEKLDKAGLSA